jgi:pilus assembly protein CpaB
MNPRQRRAVLLLAVAAAGLIGVFALVADYVSNIETEVGDKITVLELTRNVNANEAITDDELVEKVIPRRWAPRAAITDRERLIGFVAASNLTKDSILEEGMLASPPELNPGEREVAILVDASTGVAGQIEPGSRVDVIASYAADGNAQQGNQRPNRSIVLVPGARVLAVGEPRQKAANTAQNDQQDPTQVVPVTFALDKLQEVEVAHAQTFAADVRLALLRPGDNPSRTRAETIYPTAKDLH